MAEISATTRRDLPAIARDFSTRSSKDSEEAFIYIGSSGLSEPEALKLNF